MYIAMKTTPKRCHRVVRLFLLLLAAPQLFASTVAAPAASRLQVTARLPLAVLSERARTLAADSPAMKPSTTQRTAAGGVTVKVEATPNAAALRLTADTAGNLRITLPVRISPRVDIPFFPGIVVYQEGCGAAGYALSLAFVPVFADGQLRFRAGRAAASAPRGYRCEVRERLGRKLRADVAAEIGRGLADVGRGMLDNLVGKLNAWVPDSTALLDLTRRPVDFGGAISLGIDAPRLALTGAAACGAEYCIRGHLEGVPRLHFGAGHGTAAQAASGAAAADGFRLPATLLFPTDAGLLPDPAGDQASGWLGEFRLRPVSRRQDLAVLQRRAEGGAQNVIWLSGGELPEAQRRHVFERPMVNLLQEILDWLSDPVLWSGVRGIDELKDEVATFTALVDRFQQDTRISLDQRGTLSFRDLRLDLHSVWVTGEAIQAAVMLSGTAELELDVAL